MGLVLKEWSYSIITLYFVCRVAAITPAPGQYLHTNQIVGNWEAEWPGQAAKQYYKFYDNGTGWVAPDECYTWKFFTWERYGSSIIIDYGCPESNVISNNCKSEQIRFVLSRRGKGVLSGTSDGIYQGKGFSLPQPVRFTKRN
jgi:hypothetical protein